MAGSLDNINDIVSQDAFDQIETRLPAALDAAAKKMIETSKVFKNNSLSTSSAASLKDEVAQTNALAEARKKLLSVNAQVDNEQKKSLTLSAQQRQQRQLEIAGAKEAIAIEKAAAAQQKENDKITQQLANDYGLLSKAYNDAALQAKNYSLQLGAEHPVTISATADAKALGEQLKNLDASVGQSQRNVGNYASAFSGLGKVWSVIRQAAYILPGVGIAGILNLGIDAVTNIYEYAKGLFSGVEALKRIKLAQDDLNKSIASTEYKNAVESINELKINIELAKEGILDKTKVLKQYNDTIGKTTGQVSSLDEAEIALTKNADAYVKMTLYKAAANIALEEAATKAVEAEQARLKKSEEYAKATDRVTARVFLDPNDPNEKFMRQQQLNAASDAAADRKKAVVKQAEEAEKAQLDIAQEFQKKAAEIAKQNKFDFFSGDEDPKKTKDNSAKILKEQIRDEDQARKARLDAEKEYSDALRDNQNNLSEENIQTNKEIWEDDTKTIALRLEAYNEYYQGRQRQVKANSEKELADIVQLEAEIQRVKGEDPSHQSSSDRALLMREDGIAERRKGIELKLGADLAKIATETAKDILTIQQSYSGRELKLLNGTIEADKDAYSRQTASYLYELSNQVKQGLVTWNEYQKGKTQITLAGNIAELTHENGLILTELANKDLSEKAKLDLEKKYYDNLQKLRLLDIKQTEDAEQKKLNTKKLAIDSSFSVASEALSGISTIESNDDKRAKEENDKQKEQVDEKYQAEIDAINATGLTQEQKDSQIADLQKKQAIEKADLDKAQAKRDHDAAVRQKNFAIAQIILNTAQAITKAYTTGLTPIDRAIAAGAAAAIGLVQLTAAESVDIPAYKTGTKGDTVHKGGVGLVGDGYVAEWIKEPNKNGYWSPSVPTYIDMPQGTKVYNPDQLATMAQNSAIKQNAYSVATPEIFAQQLVSAFERNITELKAMRRESKSKPSVIITGIDKGFKGAAQQGNAWTDYLNGNFKA